MEFSPSGFLYVADWPVNAAPQTYVRRLFQYDLWAADIQGSRVLLDSESGTNWALPSITALGLAPDGRIYMAREPFVPYLSVIEQPDLPAPACGFVQEGFNTSTPMSWLPHFMKRYHDDVSLLAASSAAQVTPRISPNPIDTHCAVLLPGVEGPCSFTWIDALGRTAGMEQAVLVQGRATLDASGLSSGPYLLHAAFGDGRAPVIQRAWVQP
ncbi:MAG: hypothetical protein IPL52_10355 [Flavobacteriales bacterium]|nr:hypothetical protein [Flavobacteriales bacterium]